MKIITKLNQSLKKGNKIPVLILQYKSGPKWGSTFSKQKGHKVTNCDRRISIGNKVGQNYLIRFIEISCPFKIAEENEIGTIIQPDIMIWKNVCHAKIHLIKSKINPNKKRPDKNYLFAIITCYKATGLAMLG